MAGIAATGVGCLGVLFVMFCIGWTIYEVQRARKEVPPGSSWLLSHPTWGEKSAPVALDEPTLEAIWCVANPPNLPWIKSKAMSALKKAIEDGRAIVVANEQTHAEVIEAKPCNIDTEAVRETKRVKIRILEGENAGKEGWVSSRWLRQDESK